MQKRLKRPNASFMFNPSEFLCDTRELSAAQIGRLFTRILRAVDNKDVPFLAQYSRFVGKVYWRDSYYDMRPQVPQSVRRAVLARDGSACVECGADDRIELDHYIPWSKGGQHTIENLRVLCKRCNRRKGAKLPGGQPCLG